MSYHYTFNTIMFAIAKCFGVMKSNFATSLEAPTGTKVWLTLTGLAITAWKLLLRHTTNQSPTSLGCSGPYETLSPNIGVGDLSVNRWTDYWINVNTLSLSCRLSWDHKHTSDVSLWAFLATTVVTIRQRPDCLLEWNTFRKPSPNLL
jgi:hypothetical protein